MKKFFALLISAAAAILPLAAATPAETDPADVKMETKTYALSGFSGLQVGWTYQVALTQADHYTVRVEAPDFVVPYLDVKVAGDRLILDVKEMPRDIRKKVEMVLRHDEIRAWVAMPDLSSLKMSGASRLKATGEFSAKRFDFKMELSGASNLEGLSISAGEAEIQCNGAAKFQLQGDFADLKMELSGATSGSLDCGDKPIDETEIQLAGAVKQTLKGSFRELSLKASGAVSFKLEGSVRDLGASGSGAAKLDLLGAPTDKADISLSGAAKAEINVLQDLEVGLSGAATCLYKAGPNLRITEQTVSRGASLKRL